MSPKHMNRRKHPPMKCARCGRTVARKKNGSAWGHACPHGKACIVHGCVRCTADRVTRPRAT